MQHIVLPVSVPGSKQKSRDCCGQLKGKKEMEKTLTVFLTDNNDDENRQQTVWSEDVNTVRFRVYDLTECPEDAIIGRDLFNAHDYIRAIKTGMELAVMGYTNVEVKEMPWENE